MDEIIIRKTPEWRNGYWYYKNDASVRAIVDKFVARYRTQTVKERGVLTEIAILAIGTLDYQDKIRPTEETKQERIDIVLQTLGLERTDIGVIT